MELNKLSHDIYEAVKHWHIPLLFGIIGSVKISRKVTKQEDNCGLGDTPGDNILPKEILNSLISRRSP